MKVSSVWFWGLVLLSNAKFDVSKFKFVKQLYLGVGMSRSPSRCSGPDFGSPPQSAGLIGPHPMTFGSLDGPNGAASAGSAGEALQVPSASSSRRPSMTTNIVPHIIGTTTVLEASRKAFLHVSIF